MCVVGNVKGLGCLDLTVAGDKRQVSWWYAGVRQSLQTRLPQVVCRCVHSRFVDLDAGGFTNSTDDPPDLLMSWTSRPIVEFVWCEDVALFGWTAFHSLDGFTQSERQLHHL